MFEWIHPRFMSAKLRHQGAAVQLLLLVATLGACTKDEPQDVSDRIARQTLRDRELGQIRLDPASCPGGGDGMLYVALGDLVIRVPNFSAPTMRSPVYSDADKLPIPPMPDAPEGCKEHPARAQALHLSFLVAQSPGHVAAPLRAISVYRNDMGRSHNQESNERQFDRMRAQSECTRSPSGLTICGSRTDDSPVAGGLQVAGGNVAGAQRWVAVCGIGSVLVDDCEVHYLLRKGMVVRYLFKQHQVPLERMFELDPSIRNWLNSIVVENYPWRFTGAVGGVVTPAPELLTFVPSEETLEVEATVLNKDIGFVPAGQRATIKVESFPYFRYGYLEGIVESVSHDAAQSEELGLVFNRASSSTRRRCSSKASAWR